MTLKTKPETLIYKIWNCINANPGIKFDVLIKIFNSESYLTVCNTIDVLVKRNQIGFDKGTYFAVGPEYMYPKDFNNWVFKMKRYIKDPSDISIESLNRHRLEKENPTAEQLNKLYKLSLNKGVNEMSLNTEPVVENKEIPEQEQSFCVVNFTKEDAVILQQLKDSFKAKFCFVPTTEQVFLHSINLVAKGNIFPQQQPPVMPPQWINPRHFTNPPGFNPNFTCDGSGNVSGSGSNSSPVQESPIKP